MPLDPDFIPDPNPDALSGARPAVPRAPRGPAQDNLHALAKDVRTVTARAQALRDQALSAQQIARATRARRLSPSPDIPDLRLTVPEACALLGVCERTLRLALRAPEYVERLHSGTRKAGTFYKTVCLLPPDLVDDLRMRFSKKSVPLLPE